MNTSFVSQQAELKQLDLSNNKLRTLTPHFWFAPKLAELNLALDLLCDLPSSTAATAVSGASVNDDKLALVSISIIVHRFAA